MAQEKDALSVQEILAELNAGNKLRIRFTGADAEKDAAKLRANLTQARYRERKKLEELGVGSEDTMSLVWSTVTNELDGVTATISLKDSGTRYKVEILDDEK